MGVAGGAAEDEFPHAIMLDPEQRMPYLRVNKLGKRFTPEYEPYGHLALAIQAQPGTYDFYVVDSAIGEKIDKIWTPSSSCYGPKEVWTAAATSEHALKADTLEELAEMLDVDKDEFLKSVERYNKMCEAGVDTDFYKTADKLISIGADDGPFYGASFSPGFLTSLGGLRTDSDLRVLDENDQPIEGLFNAGCMIGNFYSGTYTFAMEGMNYGATCITLPYVLGKDLGSGKLN